MSSDAAVIAALATPPGTGGVALIRMSGDGVYPIADRLTHLPTPPSQRPANTFVYAPLYGAAGEVLDDAVLLFYRAPHSYTGEDTVELCVHGGAMVVQSVLERLWQLGARPAEPGEFTKRAFLNGRLDLTQAEAVADLISARAPRAERAARANLQGHLANHLSPLYESALVLSAEVEHLLDFDEGELPASFFADTAQRLHTLVEETQSLLATWHEGRLVREGALVVIAGRPNVGKSSLLNLLLGYDRAIVSEEAGTTRDVVEESFLLDGIPIRLTDTAGLRETENKIEREGIARARTLLEQADLVLYLTLGEADDTPPEGAIVLHTKADLRAEAPTPSISTTQDPAAARATVCALLRQALALSDGATPHATLANARQFTALTTAHQALYDAATCFAQGEIGYVTAAQRLREATEALGQLLGRTWSHDLLDRIFSSFCVGK